MNSLVAKGASDVGRFSRRTLFYPSARAGFQDLLEQRLKQGASGVLLPAFIGWSPREGSGVFDPVRITGSRAAFYDLNPDLTVNLDVLEAALRAAPYDILVLIHYFGRTDPSLDAVAGLAAKYGVTLVEDLAHGFFSAQTGGAAGDRGAVGLYSLHKMFAVPEGGMMIYNDPSLVTGQSETAPELARVILDYDWSGISKARKENFDLLLQALADLPECGDAFELLWPVRNPDDTPQTLPVRILRADRDGVYHRLNAEGYGMTSLYHTLIENVRQDFPQMVSLSRSIINFPVHQDASPAALRDLVVAFQNALKTV